MITVFLMHRRKRHSPAKACLAVLALAGVFAARPASAQTPAATIAGRVVNEHGQPMQYVSVQLVGTFEGDVTDSSGVFRFQTRRQGKQLLRASMMGYEPKTVPVEIHPQERIWLDLQLEETLIMFKEAVVTASAFSTGEEESVTLRSLEVVTTPGAAADIFLAIKSFPGVAMFDEGSGLFVRGGDVSETATLLDGATLVHPYKFETPTGGVFGTISPFLLRGTFFASGGFSAKYGNALSGVLAMESLDMPQQNTYTLGLGLAAASAGISQRLAHGKLGVHFSGNQSFTDAMFRLNGELDEFTLTPRSTDGNLSIIYHYSPTGRLKLFNFANSDRIGVRVDQPSFDGIFSGEENSRLHNLIWQDIFSGWLVKSSLSHDRYRAEKNLGNFALSQRDDAYKLRVDAEKDRYKRLTVSQGFEVAHTRNTFHGEVPDVKNVLDPDAATIAIDDALSATRAGAYFQIEARLSRRWFVNFGLRGDYHSLSNEIAVDPRAALRLQLTKARSLRFSWGRYSQFPAPYLFNSDTGNPHLHGQTAWHAVITYEHTGENTLFRTSAYLKTYDRLVIPSNSSNYENRGDGFARGVDVFLKYGAFLQTKWNGWISYSFLHSRRYLARQVGDRYTYETAPSPFDITHNLTVVAKAQVYQYLSAGLTFRYATGRPVTPIVGSLRQEPYDYYLPIEGPVNRERLPSFQRLDASLSWYRPFGYGHAAVFYLGLSNLLNRANVLDYDYNRDYSMRAPRTSNYKRFIYFGVSVSFVRS